MYDFQRKRTLVRHCLVKTLPSTMLWVICILHKQWYWLYRSLWDPVTGSLHQILTEINTCFNTFSKTLLLSHGSLPVGSRYKPWCFRNAITQASNQDSLLRLLRTLCHFCFNQEVQEPTAHLMSNVHHPWQALLLQDEEHYSLLLSVAFFLYSVV